MIKPLHQAAQYLAATAISFIKAEADDSHSNLGWDSASHRLLTHPLSSEDDQLGLNFDTLALDWLKNGIVLASYPLAFHTHAEVINWIQSQVEINRIKGKYLYKFHYNLPYADLADNHMFKFDQEQVKSISQQLDMAQLHLIEFLKKHQLNSPIRIWPHHFDISVYAEIDTLNHSFIGAGYAIPDDWIEDFYYYVTGWRNNNPIKHADFSNLTYGQWHQKDHKGLTYALQNLQKSSVSIFLDQALKGYKNAN